MPKTMPARDAEPPTAKNHVRARPRPRTGLRMAQSEESFQRAVMDLCAHMGLLVFHSGDSRRDSTAGFPDLVIVGKHGIVFAELKSEKGRVRPEQIAWLTALAQARATAVIWRPQDIKTRRIVNQLRSIQ